METKEDEKKSSFIQRAYVKSCDVLSDFAEYFASLSIGQAVLKQTDRLLWTVEKCAEWSIPTNSAPKHTSNGTFGKPSPLVRPLPWLLFLPMLIVLRGSRFFLNVCAMLMGIETIKPITMVRFIQIRRRRIRALKFSGLRKIRHKQMQQSTKLSWRETFYNIMSRAMCFRVTNSDMYEQITVKKNEDNKQAGCSKPNKTSSEKDKDLKRKYDEILTNNFLDWDDVEDGEELIERIAQLAEEDDSEDDPDFLPLEDSQTEDDTMSETEDDAAAATVPKQETNVSTSSSPPPKHILQRPSSHSSLTKEPIQEENEEDNNESDNSTISGNSEDESSQQLTKNEIPDKSSTNKQNENKNNLNVDSTVVSGDEFFSPINSNKSMSPEFKIDGEITPKCNNNQNNNKEISEQFINAEKKHQVPAMNNNSNKTSSPLPVNHQQSPDSQVIASGDSASNPKNSNSNFNSPAARQHGKKTKHRRRFSNLLRRKRK